MFSLAATQRLIDKEEEDRVSCLLKIIEMVFNFSFKWYLINEKMVVLSSPFLKS